MLGSRIPPYRYDYFLIWGHGLQYQDQIIDTIRSHEHLEILSLIAHRPRSIKHLVKCIYSYDYAPYFHLRSKTRYLMTTPREVLFIFLKNHLPAEDWSGENDFRHIESATLKPLKESLRDRFNDRIDGKRTEDHVVHASDNELQTHHILKYLNRGGVTNLCEKRPILDLPNYIRPYQNITIKKVDIDSIDCRILKGDRFEFQTVIVPIAESPHYKSISENTNIYEDYLDSFLGGPLTQDYSLKRFLKLDRHLDYLGEANPTGYVTVEEQKNSRYLILDGLHRASILLKRGIKQITVAILK